MLRMLLTEDEVDFLPRRPVPPGLVPELDRRYSDERGVRGEGDSESRWDFLFAVVLGWAAPDVSTLISPLDVTGVKVLP